MSDSRDVDHNALDLTVELIPLQGPSLFSSEQDVSAKPGGGSGPDPVSHSESGPAQTHQRVHYPSHTAVLGKYVVQLHLTLDTPDFSESQAITDEVTGFSADTWVGGQK